MSNTNKSSTYLTQTLNIRTASNFNTAAAAAVNSGLVRITRGTGSTNRSSSSQVDVQPLLALVLTETAVPPILPPAPPTITLQYAVFTTVGQTNWTAPAGAISPITYWIVGGGGGGGGTGGQQRAAAGGGGGGQVLSGTFNIVPGRTYIALVGSGGTGGRASYTGGVTNPINGTAYEENGRDGGFSIFNYDGNPYVIAYGGEGGVRSLSAPGGYGVGGAINTGGTVGGRAGNGNASEPYGGGGGGGQAGAGGNGPATPISTPAPGGVGGIGLSASFPAVSSGANVTYGAGGNGGAYITTSRAIGQNGIGYGSGGDGSSSSAATTGLDANGGAGSNGIIVISYFI